MIINQIVGGGGLDIKNSVEGSYVAESAIQKGEFIQIINSIVINNPQVETGIFYTYRARPEIKYFIFNPYSNYYNIFAPIYNGVSGSSVVYYVWTLTESSGTFTVVSQTQIQYFNGNTVYFLQSNGTTAIYYCPISWTESLLNPIRYTVTLSSGACTETTTASCNMTSSYTGFSKIDDSHFCIFGETSYYMSCVIYTHTDSSATIASSLIGNTSDVYDNSNRLCACIYLGNNIILGLKTYISASSHNFSYVTYTFNSSYTLTKKYAEKQIGNIQGYFLSLFQVTQNNIVAFSENGYLTKISYNSTTGAISTGDIAYIGAAGMATQINSEKIGIIFNESGIVRIDIYDLNSLTMIQSSSRSIGESAPRGICYNSNKNFFVTTTCITNNTYLRNRTVVINYNTGAGPAISKIDGVATSSASAGGTVTFITDANYSPGSVYSPATATASEILEGYTAWSNGELLEGTNTGAQIWSETRNSTAMATNPITINCGFTPKIVFITPTGSSDQNLSGYTGSGTGAIMCMKIDFTTSLCEALCSSANYSIGYIRYIPLATTNTSTYYWRFSTSSTGCTITSGSSYPWFTTSNSYKIVCIG